MSKLDQLNGLAREDSWFGSESIIIVTTIDESFLKIRRYSIYRVESQNLSEALQLFLNSKAFNSPIIDVPHQYLKGPTRQH